MTLKLNDPSLIKSQAYINGQWVDADSGETLAVTNPATGEVLTQVAKCGTAETRRMIEAAETAQKAWAKTTAKERAAVLRNWFNLMMENQEDLAQLLTAEQGKPLAEARGEIAYGANYAEWFSEESKRVYGDTIPQHSNDERILVIKQPVGSGLYYPLEFPQCHADPQNCPGYCRWLCGSVQTSQRDSIVGTGTDGAGRASRISRGLGKYSDWSHWGNWCRTHQQPDCAQSHLYRINPGRQAVDG